MENETQTVEMPKSVKQKRSILTYLKKYRFWAFLYVFLTIIASVSDIFQTIMLANSVELITVPDIWGAMKLILGVVGIQVFQRICWYFLNLIYFKYSNKIMADLNADLAKQAFKLNSKTYNDHDTGTFVQRIVDDPARVVDNLASIVDVLMEMVTSVIMMIYILTLNVWISLIFVFIVLVGFVIEYKRVRVRRKNRAIVRKKNDKINSLTTEIVRSEKDIKSLNLEGKLAEVSKSNYEDYRNTRYKMDITDTNFWSVRNFIIGIGGMLVLVFGLYLMDKGLLTLAAFMIIYANRGSLWNLVAGIGQLTNMFVDIKVCQGRMFSLFDEKEFVTEKFGDVKLDNVIGKIEFKDVSYTFREYEYPKYDGKKKKKRNGGGASDDEIKVTSENKIFDRLSFEIQPNTTVAFVGKSGSGKSTILNLMSKMYECDDGQVLIDGVDIKTLDKQTLRSTISLVNQFPYIFDMTIKENLLLAKADATDEEVKEAIKKASLEEFVDSLPLGIETKVGESGIKLSGGQKQRLAIARALLRNSNIIIFDESTSSLDNFAQEEVKKSIDGLKGHSTIVIVAHRLSTIKDVDKIFFLDSGEIVDSGTFDQLFKKNQKFKAMFLAENV